MYEPETLKPPSLLLTLSEAPRALAERASLCGQLYWLRRMPQGDGHPVMIIPGFVGDDSGNQPLIDYLEALGYKATGWNLGRNLGHGLLDPEILIDRVNSLFNATGQPVSLVGHSLGGVYAREIAKLWSHEVRQVITLGSPFGEGRSAASHATKLYRAISPHRGDDDDAEWAAAPPVPTTSVYSRYDGIINWKVSLQADGHAETENIEIYGSHTGMTVNPVVWYLLADRLAQPLGNWRPFERKGFGHFIYPTPVWQATDSLEMTGQAVG